MPRRERPIDPSSGPLQRFAYDLRRLRAAAGNPTYRALARAAGYSATTLSEAAGGLRQPTLDVVLAYVGACAGDRDAWRSRWHKLEAKLNPPSRTPRAGPPRSVPRQLPAAVAHFAGREAELERLTALIRPADSADRALVISAVGGTAGVGNPNPGNWHTLTSPDDPIRVDLQHRGRTHRADVQPVTQSARPGTQPRGTAPLIPLAVLRAPRAPGERRPL